MTSVVTSAVRTTSTLLKRHAHLNWALADQAVISGANFFTGILLARQFGIAGFGQFSLLWLIIVFVQSFQHAAIVAPMLSIGPKLPAGKAGSYYSVVIFHQLVFACFSTAIVVAGLYIADWAYSSWNLAETIWPVGAAVLISQLQEFIRRYYFTIGQPHISFATDALRYGVQLALLLWLLFAFGGRVGLAEVYWAIAGAAAVGSLAAASSLGAFQRPDDWREVTARHWHFSKWLLGSTVLMLASGNIFLAFAGAIIGASAVGVLRAAQNVMAGTHVLFLGLDNFLPVRAASAYAQGGIHQLVGFLRTAFVVITLATVAFASLVCVFSDPLMEFVYGPEFAGYGWVLIGFAVGYVLVACRNVIPVGLLTLERTFSLVLARGVAVAFSLISAYPLITMFGLSGVLVGLIMAEVILVVIPYAALKRLVADGGHPAERPPNAAPARARGTRRSVGKND
jgi:O-antigen/teichoic acid export membrane protein